MATPTIETERRQYTDRDLGLIEGRQEQGLKRLEDLIETVRELNRKVDRYYLTLLSITIGGFITLANMIARLGGG